LLTIQKMNNEIRAPTKHFVFADRIGRSTPFEKDHILYFCGFNGCSAWRTLESYATHVNKQHPQVYDRLMQKPKVPNDA
jgi:hypothetical protein